MEKKLCKEAQEYVTTDVMIGDFVSFKKKLVYSYARDGMTDGKVVEISDNGMCKIIVCDGGFSMNQQVVEVHKDNLEKNPLFIGYDPFKLVPQIPRLNLITYDIGCLLSLLLPDYREHDYYIDCNDGKKRRMEELNWNPYVIDKNGERQYYQRNFCWTLEDKRNLIESIYRGTDCGKIVLRKHSFQEVERELKNGNDGFAFNDIVDGKQRLDALIGFVHNQFMDKNGHYYDDFSILAKRQFERKACFSLINLDEKTTDEDVLKIFMLVNFAGKEMSKEHLEYVDSILKKM